MILILVYFVGVCAVLAWLARHNAQATDDWRVPLPGVAAAAILWPFILALAVIAVALELL